MKKKTLLRQHHRVLTTSLLASCLLLVSGCSIATREARDGSGFSELAAGEIGRLQDMVNTRSIGERIAFWAEEFINTPYDTDPLGEYVRSEKVVCDFRVDCMYIVFRSVELAQANTPEGATDRALDLRFHTRGRIRWGRVVNYDDRFQYAEDMIDSGRWGREITAEVADTVTIAGTRHHRYVTVIPKSELVRPETVARLKTGDLVFFIKDPEKRMADEVVGHLGVLKMEDGKPWLIHASGTKRSEESSGGGVVKKVPFADYLAGSSFLGAKLTRFE